jgi:hypothetical protein
MIYVLQNVPIFLVFAIRITKKAKLLHEEPLDFLSHMPNNCYLSNLFHDIQIELQQDYNVHD